MDALKLKDYGRTGLPWLLLLAAFVFVYWAAINEFVYDWAHDDNYSHGFLIPVISAGLLWHKRAAIARVRIRKSTAGLALLLSGLLLYVAGTAAAERRVIFGPMA